jgi:uncharacterized membrane-anchored protein
MILAKLAMVEQATFINSLKAYGLMLIFICIYGLLMMALGLFERLNFAMNSFPVLNWLPAVFVSTPAIMMTYNTSFIKVILLCISSFFMSAVLAAVFIYSFNLPRTWKIDSSSMQSESSDPSYLGLDESSSILDE